MVTEVMVVDIIMVKVATEGTEDDLTNSLGADEETTGLRLEEREA